MKKRSRAMPQVDYFFSFTSCFSALADSRIDKLVADCGAGLVPIPVVISGAPQPEGLAAVIGEFKISYLLEDAQRWFERIGLPWNPPAAVAQARWPGHRVQGFPDSVDATAGWYFAREKGLERAYRNRIFRAFWCEARDIGDAGVLVECAAESGLPPDDFAAALREHRLHPEMLRAIQRMAEARVFGFPTFVVNGKRFWGNDRVEDLRDEIRRSAA
jgi:2-hydroxychromene-2-carboxylate isomerase